MTTNLNPHCGICRHAHWPRTFGLYADMKTTCRHPVWEIMPQPTQPEVHLHDGAACPCFEHGGQEPTRSKE